MNIHHELSRRKKKKLERKLRNGRLSFHHVPPRSKGWNEKDGFILAKRDSAHRAYHTLFSNAGSLEECIEILARDWWTPRG